MNATSSEKKSLEISAPCKFKLIYIYRINGSAEHKKCLKIGEATLHEDRGNTSPEAFLPNCPQLWAAARSRVKEQTHTAGLFNKTEILHAEIAVTKTGKAFRDVDVHRVLQSSSIARAKGELSGKEWFVCDLETAKSAIAAVKAGKKILDGRNISQNRSPIEFRPEQERAIKQTVARFQKGHKRFLWDAKMRFGKTLCALEVARRMKFKRTIIVTHRPDVKAGWLEDFEKIFFREEDKNCACYKIDGTANSKKDFGELENRCKKSGAPYVIFASLQFLRGQTEGDTIFKKKVAGTPWDFVIVDEAHEGTGTNLGESVLRSLTKNRATHKLALSGTAFSLAKDYAAEEIFTWDYIEEQRAKREWEENHPGEPNPYASLPEMVIRTYSLGDILNDPARFLDTEDKAFTFSEFFRIDGEDDSEYGAASGNKKFIHEDEVGNFLDLLAGASQKTNSYPFANPEFRAYFKHSFWLVPGVKAAARLAKLLEAHEVFGNFKIINVAGAGNANEDEEKKALARVKKAIRENEYTITISCGRLTTGVTVPEWTAVFYLAGSSKTKPAAYMQTIFRVQSPGSVDGRAKEKCYVFDFAPDRTLSVIEEVATLTARRRGNGAGNSRSDHEILREFLNFMPIIAVDGSATRELDADHFFSQLRRYCIEQVVRRGFASPRILNAETLNALTAADMTFFGGLQGKLGALSREELKGVDINAQGFDDVKTGGDAGAGGVPAKKRVPARARLSEEEKERKKRKENAIVVLLTVMARCPLLVFGARGDVGKKFTPENFADQFDDISWAEFMGKISKKEFSEKIAPCLDETVFTGACTFVRERVEAADTLPPFERIKEIVGIHSEFKNPDKETVLTPWRVVNMQCGDTLGGYNFFDKKFANELAGTPRFIDEGEVTSATLGNANARILEINSKTGLYPLYVAYSLMRAKLSADPNSPRRGESESAAEIRLWKSVVAENVFVVCRTEMAAAITRRTLLGFDKETHANIVVEPNLTESAANEKALLALAEKLRVPATYENNFLKIKMLKFNAIVGNPPYQKMDGGAQASASPVYQHFVRLAKALTPDYFSLIIPARWYAGGKGLDDFREEMLNDRHIKKMFDFINPQDCFKNVDIKGGVCYFLWSAAHDGKCEVYSHTFEGARPKSRRFLREGDFDIFIRDERMISILRKIIAKEGKDYTGFDTIVSARKPYCFGTNFFDVAATSKNRRVSETRKNKTDFKVYGLFKKKRAVRYVPVDYLLDKNNIPVLPKKDGVDKFKIFVPCNYGCGEVGEVPSTPVLATPGEICTETFLQISPFESARERDNCFSYFKTKFFRLLVGIRKQNQHGTQDVYRFVPIQDFSKAWTDEELYEKYELTAAEIDFINKMIRPMQ